MLFEAQTDFQSENITKKSNFDIPLTVYVRGSTVDSTVSGGTVTLEVLSEDGDFHSYPETVINKHSVSRVYLHQNAVYRVVISGMSSPVDVEIV